MWGLWWSSQRVLHGSRVIAGIGDPNSRCHCHPSHIGVKVTLVNRQSNHFTVGEEICLSLYEKKMRNWAERDFVIPSFCLPGNSNDEIGEKILKPQHKEVKSPLNPYSRWDCIAPKKSFFSLFNALAQDNCTQILSFFIQSIWRR